MATCPNCKGTNILIKREATNAYRSGSSYKWSSNYRTRSSSTSIRHQTVGVCKDCGYTWTLQSDPTILGCLVGGIVRCIVWVFKISFYPIPLSIWLWKRKMNVFIKILLTLFIIASYIGLFIFSSYEYH